MKIDRKKKIILDILLKDYLDNINYAVNLFLTTSVCFFQDSRCFQNKIVFFNICIIKY